MSEIKTEEISLKEIYDLAFEVFTKNGCNKNKSNYTSK